MWYPLFKNTDNIRKSYDAGEDDVVLTRVYALLVAAYSRSPATEPTKGPLCGVCKV